MRNLSKALMSAIALLVATPNIPAAEVADTSLPPSEIVKATLIADTTAAEPNTTITLGILYKIAPGWHIYWKNPGASGLGTKVEWGLPGGMGVGESQYPVPVMFESPGPITSYGYDGEVLVLMEARTPATINGPLQITAKSRWLMCSDRCIPGKQDLTLTLPAGKGQPANKAVFDKYRALLPKRVNAAPAGVKAEKASEGNKTTVDLTITPTAGALIVGEDKLPGLRRAYFFPETQDGLVFSGGEPSAPDAQATVDGQTVKAHKAPMKINYTLEAGGSAAAQPRIAGVLVYQEVSTDGKATAPKMFDLQLP